MEDTLPFSLTLNSESVGATSYNNETTDDYTTTQEDNDNIAKTPEEVLTDMKIAWVNENCSPILLPHKFESAECLLDQIDNMESNIDSCRNKASLKVAAHKLEVLRIGYMVNDYIRIRLEKIEQNSRGVLKIHRQRIKDGKDPLLAEEEYQFLAKYAQAEAKLLGSTLLAKLPQPFRKIAVPDINTEHERVFAHVVTDDAEAVEAPDYRDRNADVIIDLPENSVHLIPFDSIQDHLDSGKVRLM